MCWSMTFEPSERHRNGDIPRSSEHPSFVCQRVKLHKQLGTLAPRRVACRQSCPTTISISTISPSTTETDIRNSFNTLGDWGSLMTVPLATPDGFGLLIVLVSLCFLHRRHSHQLKLTLITRSKVMVFSRMADITDGIAVQPRRRHLSGAVAVIPPPGAGACLRSAARVGEAGIVPGILRANADRLSLSYWRYAQRRGQGEKPRGTGASTLGFPNPSAVKLGNLP